MNHKSYTYLISFFIVLLTLLGIFLFIGDDESIKRMDSEVGNMHEQIKVINGPSALDGVIKFSLEEFDPPLHLKVLPKESIILNAREPQEPWIETFLLSWNPTQIGFERYRAISTHEALLYGERETKEKFDSAMALATPPSDWAGMNGSIVWKFQISSSAGDFVFIVMNGGLHLSSLKEVTDPNHLTYNIFRLSDGKFLIESPKVLEKIGLDKFNYKSLDFLRSLSSAEVIDMSSNPVKIVQ